MKTIRNIILLLLPVICVVACSKDFLDRDPLGQVTVENYYESEDDAISAVTGIYSNLLLLYNGREYIDYETMTDNACNILNVQWGGYEFTTSSQTPKSEYALKKWEKNYRGITSANLLLENINKCFATNPESKRKPWLEGEAYFLRAHFYLDLINFYGDVPLLLTPQEFVGYRSARVAKNLVLDQIVKDLDSAIVRLPIEYSGSDYNGRATKGAALALKGKALLFHERFDDAVDPLRQVVYMKNELGANAYELFDNYQDLFLPDNKFNKEFIFAVQYAQGFYTQGLTHDLNLYLYDYNSFGPTLSLAEAYYTTNGLPISEDFTFDPANPFDNRDPRLNFTLVVPHSSYPHPTATNPTFQPSSNQPTGMKIRKYVVYYLPKNSSSHNIPLIRYADVLLMYAEAMVKAGGYPDSEIRRAIDMVRQRPSVMMPKVEDVEGVNLSEDQYMKIIMHERRVELTFEGHRVVDIRRWRIGEQVMTDAYGYSDTDAKKSPPVYTPKLAQRRNFNPVKDYLWPIPQTEIDANPDISPGNQNPGY